MPRASKKDPARNVGSGQTYATETQSHPSRATPVHRLPLEILCHVFQYTLPPVGPDWLFTENAHVDRHLVLRERRARGYQTKYRAPAVLLAVCKKWKAAAEGDAGLWQRILIDDFDSSRQVRWAELHVKHSGNRALTVHIDTTGLQEIKKQGLEHPSHTQFLQPIMANAHRWRELILYPDGLTRDHLASLFSTSAPGSTFLFFRSTFVPTTQRMYEQWVTSSGHVRRLTFGRESHTPAHVRNFIRGISQDLRDLSLQGYRTPAEVLAVLQGCAQLEILHVALLGVATGHEPTEDIRGLPVVVARNLHTLLVEVWFQLADPCVEVIQHLQAPRLRHLSVEDIRRSPSDVQAGFWSDVSHMLVASRARLKRLSFTGRVMHLANLIALDHFQDLEQLSAKETTVPGWFAEMMIIDEDRHHLPRLQDLSLGTCWGDPQRSLDRMVLSRRGTLRVLDIGTLAHPYDMTVLQEARADWLMLYIRNS
ncbi:uncharacterized protein SCHCODRAFT_02542815 [Schizophyllum commune H4-8]|nr:uncharacterized protein SCHCODRAFT_02542815 [Schizophyllum commune H4-8]KAI5892684.1 hypothetical protein SCHCODRAFT_02542815 [Schizophyllum commune H4-8]